MVPRPTSEFLAAVATSLGEATVDIRDEERIAVGRVGTENLIRID
jgi:hypothetical protein